MDTALSATPSRFFELLGHELRWQLLTSLAHGDRRVHELVEILGQPQNLVSYHLKRLRDHHLVVERHSAADARDVYYSLDLARARSLFYASGVSLHPALDETKPMGYFDALPAQPVRVLFLCTHNSARSQMAEAVLRHVSHGRIEAFSAGSDPSRVHPFAVRAMAEVGIDISRQRSKHLDHFLGQKFDYIITVCDRVREVCPLFPDDPERIHWSFPDPAAVQGSEEERYQAFQETATQLTTRIHFLSILIERAQRGQ